MKTSLFPHVIRTASSALTIALVALACTTDRNREDERDGPSSLPRLGLRKDVVGCWALFDNHGRSAEGQIEWAPTFVSLDSGDTATTPSSVRPAVRFGPTWSPLPLELERGIQGWVKWRADSLTDSIRINFSNAFSGSTFVFSVPPQTPVLDTIRGYATEFYDYGPPWTKAMGAAIAVRVPCRT